ncbi:MAG: hypothetical protein HY820_28110 [Acidobacteria bacterium]|nr:hypothetical protein [Acidobacteriota bacterium]
MKTRSSLALFAALAAHADTAFVYQNGASAYAGAKDFAINTQYSQYNGGNGVRWTGDPQLGCYTTTGSGAYTVRYLLKFGAVNIPAGSVVTSATLTLAVESWNPGSGSLTGYYLKNSWDPASSRLGWIHRNATQDWAGGGASVAGTDTVSGKTFTLPPLRPVGVQTFTIPLDRAQVQSWVDAPATNQGIMLVNNTPGEIVRILSTTGTQRYRPKLTINVGTVSGTPVSINPTAATLQPGQTQQFTANTAVTWTATGGTVTATGLYTAGATAGSFTVTATSTADPTKSAAAAITIQPAPVQVTVSPTAATLQPGQTTQFTANTAVTWTATGGTVTATGLYTAGASTGDYFVRATSTTDPTKSATAAITIQPAPVQVTINPTTATLQPGQTTQFTANTAVTWTATGGTVTSTGLYTAGATAGSFTVTATSTADPTKSAAAAITIQPAPVQVIVSPTAVTLQPGQTTQFTANTAVTWTATGGTVTATGLYTAGASTGGFLVRATSTADTTKSATAPITIQSSSGTPPPVPRMSDGAYVVLQSPVAGMHFTAPAAIRLFADPYDPDAADPDALTVTFLINGQPAGTYTGSGAQNGYFAHTVNNLIAGTYTITAQITARNTTVTSAPVTVFVDNPAPSTGPIYNLTADVVLNGSQAATYAGTTTNRCLISGNGFQIRSAAGFTGSLTIANCDIRGLGTSSTPAINVAVNGAGYVQLTGNVFETFGQISLAANDQARLNVQGNELRENTLVPVGSQPSNTSTLTVPVFYATGNSSAQQYFQGNNVGLSTVVFERTRNWMIGGADADSNILMGVRCGFTISQSTGMVLRGNYSQHNYPHRFSQGQNFELSGDGFLVEHNVIRNSSWAVRGMGGEFRYNLVDQGGNSHASMQAPMSNSNIHHNVFLYSVSQTLYAPDSVLSLFYNVDNVTFRNNVLDGGGAYMAFYGSPVAVQPGSYIGSLRNNVIFNFASLNGSPALAGAQGESTTTPLLRLRYADYNAFYNPNAPNQANYGLGVIGRTPGSAGYGLHDLGGFNGKMNPQFAQPTAIPFPFLPQDIWTRSKKVSDVLASYRARYSPTAGSPLTGAGDPQDGPGNIGAVGNGEAADQFGKFSTGNPSLPVISSFTASPASVQAGQSVTLNWSVSNATALSIAPAPGVVTGNFVSVTPTATTTYTLTASNSAGSATASATVTITTAPAVGVTITPTSASLLPTATRQFTATVTNASNTVVTWTATGGTINSTGLYTAGATPGTYTATATSVQDPTKSATATITITQPQSVGITISPTTASLFTNGAQQFTATVTNATNTAVTWTATGGVITSTGLYTAGATPGVYTATATSLQDPTKSATATITITTATTSARPRIILDTATLTSLRNRAQANTSEWTALAAVCNSYIGGGTVNYPGENGYPNKPSVGEGYQGSGYYDALMPLGLCYQTTRLSIPTAAANYGGKAVQILMAMSDPNHTIVDGRPVFDRDYGYGIRNFGVAMGIGYDWFHDLLSPTQLAQLQTSLNNWISSFENNSFEYDHPQGNYFAGYYAAKCMAALAVQGDSPLGDTWWNNWYNQQHLQRVAQYYSANMGGGGWTEGFTQYGILGSRNQALPALAVRTAKGLDLIHAAQPYAFPLDQARYLMAFTWPTRDMMDDRGELYNTGDTAIWPGTTNAGIYRFFAGYLSMWGDPLAPMMHKYARDVKTSLDALHVGGTEAWLDFLFWDSTAPESDYTSSPLSYLAPGVGGVSARSDWSTSAAYFTFMSSPYINFPSAGHEPFDKGSLAIQRNRNPLVVNPAAWLTHEPNGSPGWTAAFDDRFGNWDINHNIGNRILNNTFQVRHINGAGAILSNFGQWAMQRSEGARTKVARFEDGGSYVLTVGQYLEDMYRPLSSICTGRSPVNEWSRQIVYLRPSQFVVYDRTGICDASLDQYLAFHFPSSPVEVASPGAGARRFDINPGVFAGSMTTILPASAAAATTSQFSSDTRTWNKLFRTEIRPTGTAAATRRWMTVFDLAPTAGQVAAATAVNITSGLATGALLQSSAGNSVVIAGTASFGTPISSTITYTVPAAQTRHLITDLNPSAGYTLTVVVSGATQTITIAPGGSATASANGVLTFQLSPTGQMTP